MNLQQAQKFKEEGNAAFIKQDYKLALELYGKAIINDCSNSILFSNRARAYKYLNQFQEAYNDSQKAVELDNNNIKAHLISGQSLAQIGKSEQGSKSIDKAISDMTKALTLCAGQNKQAYEKDLIKYISRAKKLKYFRELEIEQADAAQENNNLNKILSSLPRQNAQFIEKQISNWQNKAQGLMHKEIPDQYCCPITMNIFDDPVITPYGFTYEREALMEHLKNSQTDPISRKTLNIHSELIPNLILKQIVEQFKNEQPWSYEHYLNQNTVKDIEF